MKKEQTKNPYKSPGLKIVNVSARASVCQTSLSKIEIGALVESGEVEDLE